MNDRFADASNDDANLSRRSLEQALIDFEIANARVIELTKQVVELNTELKAAREGSWLAVCRADRLRRYGSWSGRISRSWSVRRVARHLTSVWPRGKRERNYQR